MSDSSKADYRVFTQRYSALMDGAFALFFEGESQLSLLTLDESLQRQSDTSISEVCKTFERCGERLRGLIQLIEEAAQLLSQLWYRQFYTDQLAAIRSLHSTISRLASAIPQLQHTMELGRLQESIQHEEENSIVTKLGVEASMVIAHILLAHSETVIETNRT